VKAWKFLLPVPFVIALAMVPQGAQNPGDPSLADVIGVVPISELNYVNPQGTTTVVSARNVVEIRLIEEVEHCIRLELFYENGDYSLIDTQGFHLLRNSGATREVKLVRGKAARMRYPKGL
jgi:hypothetical protein